MSSLLRAHLALFIVNLIYGANYLIAKGLMPDLIEPSGFIMLRVVGATALFWMMRTLFKHQPIAPADFLRLALCGLFGVAGNQLFFFNGLNLTSPINAAIIMTANPILVLVMASVLIGERISKLRVMGIALGAAGAIWLILLSADGSKLSGNWLGDVMILINAASYAVYLVIVKPLMQRYAPLTVISWVFLLGSVFVIPIGWNQFWDIEWSQFSAGNITSAAFVVIGTTFFAYLLNIFAIRIVSPSVVSSYIYLQPVTAAIFSGIFATLGWIAIDYTGGLTTGKVLSAVLIFAGVYLVSKPGLDSAKKKAMREK